MCGIAGIVQTRMEGIAEALARMNAVQAHRGPDDRGTHVVAFESSWLGLANVRLAIQDLSPAGHQPMVHPRTGDWIVLNGEIYNFQTLRQELIGLGEAFQGHSDTEVLLAVLSRWGTPGLSRLEGMYAFAYFNKAKQSLVLGRDPLGIKPLYISQAAGSFVFASEVRGVLASGLVADKLDLSGIAGLLAYGAVQHPRTLFSDIQSLPPGTWQEFRPTMDGVKASNPCRFWTYPSSRDIPNANDVVEEIHTTLDLAVRDHLIADVPVGIFLSSGLDSTVVAGLARRHVKDVRSFTVGFQDEPDFSELQLAKETAKLFGLQHTEIHLPSSEAEGAARDWLSTIDLPSLDGLNVFVISRAVRAQGIKVALSGQGGDELFGGYPSFRDVPRLRQLLRFSRALPPWARRKLAGAAGIGQSVTTRSKLVDIAGSNGSLLSIYFHRRRLLSDWQLAQLGLEAGALGLTPDFMTPEALLGIEADGADPVYLVSKYESCFYQGNTLLHNADVNGMAHSLEIRVPMLDTRLLNLVHAIPGSVRLPPSGPGKYLLRKAFPSLLRPELLRQSKRGFVLPIQRWMHGSLRPLCEESLGTLKATGILRPEGVDAIWKGFEREPNTPLWARAFILCVLGAFLRRARAQG